ncbi:MAG: hypothetical protein COA53_02995 [Rhodobacteraceae bacterium]|nr:MAG: hypothetical protein COA53_02995 [Paracoccaceae bacterium]
MLNLRTVISIISLVVLTACAGSERNAPIATSADIQSAAYASPLPASITLMTMVKENGDFGEHTGILINASQQVLYDPAGTFRHSTSPNARDVNYGMHPAMVEYYKSYHARRGYYVVAQEVQVTPEIAELIFQRAVAQGKTAKLRCAISASSVLNGIPMFSSIPTTYFPGKIMDAFAELPGVTTTYVYEDDEGQNLDG